MDVETTLKHGEDADKEKLLYEIAFQLKRIADNTTKESIGKFRKRFY